MEFLEEEITVWSFCSKRITSTRPKERNIIAATKATKPTKNWSCGIFSTFKAQKIGNTIFQRSKIEYSSQGCHILFSKISKSDFKNQILQQKSENMGNQWKSYKHTKLKIFLPWFPLMFFFENFSKIWAKT